MLAKCIFGHKNALCQSVAKYFFLKCQGGRVVFQRGFWLLPVAFLFHGKTLDGEVHSFVVV